jgi:hypothetical protein
MPLGRITTEPLRSRLLIVTSCTLSATLLALLIWSSFQDAEWRHGSLIPLLVPMLAVVGLIVYGAVALVRRRRPPRLVPSRSGLGLEPDVPLGFTAAIILLVLSTFGDRVVEVWREVGALGDDGMIFLDVVFAAVMTILHTVWAAVLALHVAVAWRGFAVEVTPEGVVVRAPLYRRLIPWAALAQGGPPRQPAGPKSVTLAVARPELVRQRGLPLFCGTREWPDVPAGRHAWLLADVIRWYVNHPEDRAAIGTEAERDRMLAALREEVKTAPVAAPTGAPVAPSRATGMPAPSERPKRVRTAQVLVHVTVGFALLIAAVDLILTIALRSDLLAAERASAEHMPAPPDGAVGFSTETAAFAGGTAISVLIAVVILGATALALARAFARGNNDARIGLAIVAGISAALALCPCGSMFGPEQLSAAGTLLNVWAGAKVLAGFATAASAAMVLVLLLLPDVIAWTDPRRQAMPADSQASA